jgi:HK97 family phage major capsid protein
MPTDQEQGASGAVCSSIVAGTFSEVLIGVRSELRIEVLRETYAGNLQFGFLCYGRFDIGVARPKRFGKLIGIL